MSSQRLGGVVAALVGMCLHFGIPARGSEIFSVTYPPSKQPGELEVEAAYYLWIPPGLKQVRAVIVHQHGCGEGAENSGETAALDWHWQALATEHESALLAPRYRARTGACGLWADPRNGSGAVFLRALTDLGQQSGHPELATVPWCLWGHSGGGYWASLMLEKYAERIVAVFCRSGAALAIKKGELPRPEFPPAAFGVPILFNPGLKERGDAKFNTAWDSSLKSFDAFRSNRALVAFAPDPLSSHDCRNSRLLAIPFFDACLRLRLPRPGATLTAADPAGGFWADWHTGTAKSAKLGADTNLNSWLPDAGCARAFAEYVTTGKTTDTTPPRRAPVITNMISGPHPGEVTLEWTAEADLESGVRQFAIYRENQLIARYPDKLNDRNGFYQFQAISFHDTPAPETPPLRFTDKTAPPNTQPAYTISVINGAGLEGPPSKPAKPPAPEKAKAKPQTI